MSDGEDFLAEEYINAGHIDESYNLGVEDEDILLADDHHDGFMHMGHPGKELPPPRTPVHREAPPFFPMEEEPPRRDRFPIERDPSHQSDSFNPEHGQFRGRGNFRSRRPRGARNNFRDGPPRFPFNNRNFDPNRQNIRPMRGFPGNRRFPRRGFEARFPDRNFGQRHPPPGNFGPRPDEMRGPPQQEPMRNFDPSEPPIDFGHDGPPPREFRINGPPNDFGPPQIRPNIIQQGPPSNMGPPSHLGPPEQLGPPPGHMGPPPPNHMGPHPGHMGPPQGHMGPPQGHMGPPQGHMGPPQGHMGPPQGHMGPPQGHMGLPPGHLGPPPGHLAPPLGLPLGPPQPQRPMGPPSLQLGLPPMGHQPLPPRPMGPPVVIQPPPLMPPAHPPHLALQPRYAGPPVAEVRPHIIEQPPAFMGPPQQAMVPPSRPQFRPLFNNPNYRPEFPEQRPVVEKLPIYREDIPIGADIISQPKEGGKLEENSLVPPGVSPDQSEVMKSPPEHASPIKQPSGLDVISPVKAVPVAPVQATHLPPNTLDVKPEGKKVLINPHFKGPVQSEILQGQYMGGKDAYYPTQPPSGNLSQGEFDRLTEQFINEQKRCLEKVKNQQDDEFFQKTQRFIENLSKDTSERDSDRDRERDREREREREREKEKERYYKQKELERLRRAQEQFIQENQLSMKRRRDSPARGGSPKRQRSPDQQNQDPEEKEYRARLREQAEMRQRVLLAKERRRKRDAATKVQTQYDNIAESGDRPLSPKPVSDRDRDVARSADSSSVSRQNVDSKGVDSTRQPPSDQRRDAYGKVDSRSQQYYDRKEDPYREREYRDERREQDYQRSEACRQEDTRQYRQDYSRPTEQQSAYRQQQSYQQGCAVDDPKNSMYRDDRTYRTDDRRDGAAYGRSEQSYRQDTGNYSRVDDRSMASYNRGDDKVAYRDDRGTYRNDERKDATVGYRDERGMYRKDAASYKYDDKRDNMTNYPTDGQRDTTGYRPEDQGYSRQDERAGYRMEDRGDGYRMDDRRDVAGYRPDDRRDQVAAYRPDDRRDQSGYREDDRRDQATYRDNSGYRVDDRRDYYRSEDSTGYRNDQQYRHEDRSNQYDDRAYRTDDRGYSRQDDKKDPPRSEDRRDRNYDRKENINYRADVKDRRYEESKKSNDLKSENSSRDVHQSVDDKKMIKHEELIKSQRIEEPKKSDVKVNKPEVKMAPVKPIVEVKPKVIDPIKAEEDLLLQDREPTLDEMLEDDTLRLSPEEEDLLLSDTESHTPPPVNRPKVDLPVKHLSKDGKTSSKVEEKSKSERSLTPPRPTNSAKRPPESKPTSSDLRTKLARPAPAQQASAHQPAPVMVKEKKRIVYDLENKAKQDNGDKGDSNKDSTNNKWRSTFTEQKLEKSAPIAARAISAALGREAPPKRTVIPPTHQVKEVEEGGEKKTMGRRVVVGQPQRTVLPPKRPQPVVIVERDEDVEDEPRSKKNKESARIATAIISGLPPGMTEARMLSICGPEVEQVTLSATEKDTATARFLSSDACDRFVRRFNGRMVAACTLKVRKGS